MTIETLEKANRLRRTMREKEDALSEICSLMDNHEANPEKELAVGKIKSGWVLVDPNHKMQLIQLMYALAEQDFIEAQKAFEQFKK